MGRYVLSAKYELGFYMQFRWLSVFNATYALSNLQQFLLSLIHSSWSWGIITKLSRNQKL
jgi:hypothetical protein